MWKTVLLNQVTIKIIVKNRDSIQDAQPHLVVSQNGVSQAHLFHSLSIGLFYHPETNWNGLWLIYRFYITQICAALHFRLLCTWHVNSLILNTKRKTTWQLFFLIFQFTDNVDAILLLNLFLDKWRHKTQNSLLLQLNPNEM